jgi:hypothetical protein
MEPLLRWLRAGNKGYKAGALAHLDTTAQTAHQIADITYAVRRDFKHVAQW